MSRLTFLITACVIIAGTTSAQDGFPYGGTMGIYFSDSEFSDATTNLDTAGAPFNMYVVLTDATVGTVAAYECGITINDPTVLLINMIVDSNQDWLEYDNHLIAYDAPLTVPPSGALTLSIVVVLYTGTDAVSIDLGPSDPSTGDPQSNPFGWTWDGPMLASDATPAGLHRCEVNIASTGHTATLNWPGTPVETRHWSGIRSLFR